METGSEVMRVHVCVADINVLKATNDAYIKYLHIYNTQAFIF